MDEKITENIDWKAKAERYEKQLLDMGVTPIEKRGLHNWKNLFRKPNVSDITMLVVIILALFMGWAYSHDVAVCREFIGNASNINFSVTTIINQSYPSLNLSSFHLITENESNKIYNGG